MPFLLLYVEPANDLSEYYLLRLKKPCFKASTKAVLEKKNWIPDFDEPRQAFCLHLSVFYVSLQWLQNGKHIPHPVINKLCLSVKNNMPSLGTVPSLG